MLMLVGIQIEFYWLSISRILYCAKKIDNVGKRHCDIWSGGSILSCGSLGLKVVPGCVEVDAEWSVGLKDKKGSPIMTNIFIDRQSFINQRSTLSRIMEL